MLAQTRFNLVVRLVVVTLHRQALGARNTTTPTTSTSTTIVQSRKQRAAFQTNITHYKFALHALHCVAMQVRQSTTTILLQFLLWCLSIQVTKSRPVAMPLNNFDPTTDTFNFSSGSTIRLRTLYNRASSRYVRIHGGRRIDAKGSQDDPHAQLLITTTDFDSRVLIQGNKSKNYLCVNGKGELISKSLQRRLKEGGTSCVFQRSVSAFSGYDGFVSVQNPSWVLAFKGNGDSKKASKAKLDTRSSQFLVMPADVDIQLNEEAFNLLGDVVINELHKAIRDGSFEGGRRRNLEQGHR